MRQDPVGLGLQARGGGLKGGGERSGGWEVDR
jgi:hypothetical protein